MLEAITNCKQYAVINKVLTATFLAFTMNQKEDNLSDEFLKWTESSLKVLLEVCFLSIFKCAIWKINQIQRILHISANRCFKTTKLYIFDIFHYTIGFFIQSIASFFFVDIFFVLFLDTVPKKFNTVLSQAFIYILIA